MEPPGLEPPGRWQMPVVAAAYLAVRGDDSGRELLRAATGALREVGWTPWGYLAVVGLDRLGDVYIWEETQRQVQVDIKKYLEEAELIAAADTLLGYQYFHELRLESEPTLGTFQSDSSRFVRTHRTELQTEADVLDLMDELFD